MLNLGDKLRRLRGQRSYTSVSEEIDCSVNTLRDVEAGRTRDPGVQLVVRLAQLYNVSLDWLTDDDQDWPPPKTGEDRTVDVVRSALAAGGLTGELSAEERQFVSLLRSLPADLRPRFVDRSLGYAEGLRSGRPAETAVAGCEVMAVGKPRKSGRLGV